MSRFAAIISLAMFASAVTPASARTIELTCYDLSGFAVISSEAPMQGWVSTGQPQTATTFGYWSSSSQDVIAPRQMLVRFDLSQIPKDVQITRAELIIPIAYQPGAQLRFAVYRIVTEWGVGVCEKFRMRRPQELPWSEPGARGVGTDRAQTATEYVELSKMQPDIRVNVTSDLELWQTGAATNQGWVMCAEEPGQWIRLASPIYAARAGWKLRVTYEPKR